MVQTREARIGTKTDHIERTVLETYVELWWDDLIQFSCDVMFSR